MIKKFFILYFFISILWPIFVFATMSSTNYKIEKDSINSGGIDQQSSTNYNLQETIGEIGTGLSSSASYKLYSGYRQIESGIISISDVGNFSMSPAIGGITGGTGNGSAIWTVTTDNSIGYTLSIKASTSPALQSATSNFADYTPSGSATPDYSWSISSSDSEFGFTIEGADTASRFLDNGSNTCNTGSTSGTDTCWYNLAISDLTIASSSSLNYPAGTATTVKFRAQSGTSHVQEDGTYSATITVTAITN